VSLAGWAVALPERFAAELRRGTPCVVARVVDGACLVDLRCVPPSEDRAVRAALLAAAARLG
jgi:L-seryl-tRNA(Ser) seleniumtransferase